MKKMSNSAYCRLLWNTLAKFAKIDGGTSIDPQRLVSFMHTNTCY